MSKIIGVREICDIAGLDANDENDIKRVVSYLRRREVPYDGIGLNQRGNKRGILIDEEALAAVIRAKAKVRKAKRRKSKRQAKLPEGAPARK